MAGLVVWRVKTETVESQQRADFFLYGILPQSVAMLCIEFVRMCDVSGDLNAVFYHAG